MGEEGRGASWFTVMATLFPAVWLGRGFVRGRYVHFLTDLHVSLKNSAEAAHAEMLHIDVLDWSSNTILPAVKNGAVVIYPQETSSKRLERLLLTLLHVRATCGTAWEQCVSGCACLRVRACVCTLSLFVHH